MSRQTKRIWRNRLIGVLAVALAVTIYIIYINSFTVYDFAHLTRTMDFGESMPFAPLGGTEVDGMVQAAETEYLALYISPYDTTFAVVDRRNGAVWHSSPQGPENIANPFHRDVMRSNMGFSFYDALRRSQHRWLYPDSAYFGPDQFEIHAIENGVRVEYIVGNLDIGLHALPRFIEEELFRERIYAYFADDYPAYARFVRQHWLPYEEHEGFLRLVDGIFDHVINTNRMLGMFERVGWTLEETFEQNALVGYVPEVSFDYFSVVMEFVLDRDRLIVNVPLNEIRTDTPAQIFSVDILRFFGAGCVESEGFMLVPSGSGGVIRFNNGKYRDVPFAGPVYGTDMLMTNFFPQVEQPVRLPVLGIQNNGAAILAHVYSGRALATVNAEVAAETFGVGGTTAQNNAWFSFHLRSSMPMGIATPGLAAGGDMTVVQEQIFEGDLTVIYHFLAGDNPGVGAMAGAYQEFLVEQGALTPLSGPGDRSFYLDIIGAVDVQRHILGTPYMTTEAMTDIADANRFIDTLNANGINTIQMQLHGWFNRGINHDVAKRVNPISGVGSRQEFQELNTRLQAAGGGLHPAVNFQLTNWYSRNFNRTFEAARDPGGYVGFMSRVARDMLFTRFSIHRNDWFILVHPAVLPFHVDRFIPSFRRQMALDGLALVDLGDMLTESIHRRNPVDREHSRLIAAEQIGRLHDEFPNIVVFGGNDYALAFASHLVDVPTGADAFHIIDYEVPFFSMVVHGFIEFAGRSANLREDYSPIGVLLDSMTTGASPRYTLTAQPTRHMQFSPHERFYSTHYVNWMNLAIEHYRIFNDVYRDLRAERIVDFIVLAGGRDDIMGSRQVTVTVFENGTRVYVNNTREPFEYDGIVIPPQWFEVREARNG